MKKLLLIFAVFAVTRVHAQIYAPTTSVGLSSTPNSVGIGTQTPLSGLGVNLLGGIGRPIAQGLYIQRSDFPATNQDGGLKIFFSSSTYPGLAGGSCAFQLVPTSNSLIPDMAFSCNSTAAQMTIKNNGNVGIGTSTPTQLLDVNGITRTKKIMISNGAAAGMVLSCTNAAGLAAWVAPSSLITEVDPKVGSLTTNKIPKWGTTTLVDSKISEVATGTQSSIAVGTTTPATSHGFTISGGLNNAIPGGLYIERNDINPATNQNCALSIAFSSSLFSSVGIGGGSCGFRLVPSVNTPTPDMAFSCNTVAPQMIIKNNGSVGIGTAAPNDKVEINSGVANHSGLRFTQLNAMTQTTAVPGDFMCNKVLTVDNNGEVILIDLSNCGSSSSKQGNDDTQLANQQAQIDDLKNQIAELKALLGVKAGAVEKVSSYSSSAHLIKIAPNPLSQSAIVSYELPADVTDAQIVITDSRGKVVKSYNLAPGSVQQEIGGSELSSGTYQYTLYIQGSKVDSKQMVVAK